jgi:hypothetical protein
MKDFAGSRTTYYSLARDKLREKHPRILISMAGFAAFLLSDILSFGLNSDHRTFLAGLEHQDSIDNIVSIMNWNEKSTEPAAVENPVAQKRRFNDPLETNTSPGKDDIVLVGANKSGDGNSSPSRAVYIGQNAKGQNLSNSSRTASNQPSSGSTIVSTGNTSSIKLVKEKKAPVIKMNHGSSSGRPMSQPLKQKSQANSTKVNTTQANTTRVNATQVNATKADAALVSNIQTNNSSTNPLQKEAVSSTRSPVYSFPLSQLQVNPTYVEASPIGQSQTRAAEIDSSQPNSALNAAEPNAGKTREDPVVEKSANEEKEKGIGLSENENGNIPSENSPGNPVITFTALAQNSADNAALPMDASVSRINPTKDTPAEKPPLVIDFKTDSTTSPGSENSLSDGSTNSGTFSNANALSGPVTPESSPNAENKETQPNVAPISTDSTSNSKSPAVGGESASLKKPDTTATSKAQKLQEIRNQKTANQNRIIESAKKRAARSRG